MGSSDFGERNYPVKNLDWKLMLPEFDASSACILVFNR